MRYIKNTELPRLTDLQELENANNEIAALATEDDRKQYIQDNSAKWTAIRPALWRLGNMKCWYSEDIIQEGEGEVEHFRPKNAVCGCNHQGYWWRAFDWRNYRIAHRTCNIRRTDYLTKKKVGKGTYFPLRDEGSRANNEGEIGREEPVLLDPINPNDVRLLCFNTSSGRPEPSPNCKNDQWKDRRVTETIGYYHLDEGTWNTKRKDIIESVKRLCDRLIEAKSQNNQIEFDNLIAELKVNYINELAVFSSVAIQVVKEQGLLNEAV